MQTCLSSFELFFLHVFVDLFYESCSILRPPIVAYPYEMNKKWFSVHVKTQLKLSSKTCTTFWHEISGRNPRNGLSKMCFLPCSFQGCLLTGCLSGGSCVNDERKQNYLCLCTKGWTGEKCETKIGKKRYYQLVKVSVSSTFQILTIFCLCLSLFVFNQSKRLVLS